MARPPGSAECRRADGTAPNAARAKPPGRDTGRVAAVDRDELVRRGIVDPSAPDADEIALFARHLLDRGASLGQLERAVAAVRAGGDARMRVLGAVSADLNLRGQGPRLTLAQAAERHGVDLDTARRVWRTLGFAEPSPDDAAVSEQEAELFALFGSLSMLEPETAFQLLRVVGTSVARIADAAVATLRLAFEVPLLSSGVPYIEVADAYAELTETLMPQTVRAADVIMRRNIALAAEQQWETDAEGSSTTARLVVGFADMVGYTAMARSLPTRDLVATIGTFEREVVDVVTDHGGRVVKLIGDEVMFVLPDPAGACRLALALAAEFADHPVVPPLRVGLATGEVLTRDGDYYGRVVNAASRLVELAEPGGVVVSDGVRERLDDAFATEALPPTRVKGYDEPVQAFRLRAPG